jgi:adenosylcobinamide kinase / adenosylcobinamide-phosphate guanylyltransferase
VHFVTGGSFNGKAKWVRNFYKMDGKVEALWISAYKKHPLPISLHEFGKDFIVLEGVEQWIRGLLTRSDLKDFRAEWQNIVRNWHLWEAERPERTLVMIGADITKGIVPVEKEHRNWRDCTGWAYQDIADLADRVDHIWYGIGQRLK